MFFFNDTATTEIYTLSLHDALPILIVVLVPPGAMTGRVPRPSAFLFCPTRWRGCPILCGEAEKKGDRKSTRLNSSHQIISYAVFCLKKKIYSKHTRKSHLCSHTLIV